MSKIAICYYCGAPTSAHAVEHTGRRHFVCPAVCNSEECIEKLELFDIDECPADVLALARQHPPYTLEDERAFTRSAEYRRERARAWAKTLV
jgi:hypothetical protein